MTLELKYTLFQKCQAHVKQKIIVAQKNIEAAQNSANTETKSSAGDKYETGRAMMHLEKEKFTRQLAQALQLNEQLSNLNPHQTCDTVSFGALIHTSMGHFFISAGIGKLQHESTTYFAMSINSPISQAIKGFKKGQKAMFRGRDIEILDVI